jgi:hypothetical protein
MHLVIVGASIWGTGTTREPIHTTYHLCTDAEFDKAHSPFGMNLRAPGCQMNTDRSATGWTVSGSCVGGKITAKAAATGDLNDRYHVDLFNHMDPSIGPETTETRIGADARWVGRCPAGKKPGATDGDMPGPGF